MLEFPTMATTKKRKGASTLNRQVYERIKLDVLTCELRPGAVVSEGVLANKYNVGKASIRHALTRLAQERFVMNQGRSGHLIRSLTLREVRELFQVRHIHEPAVTRLAAPLISDATLKQLALLSATTYKPKPGATDRAALTKYVEANRAFHITIARASGNDLLANLFGWLHDSIMRVTLLTMLASRDGVQIDHGHGEILEALAARDPERAAVASRAHVDKAEHHMMLAVIDLPGLIHANLADLGRRPAGG